MGFWPSDVIGFYLYYLIFWPSTVIGFAHIDVFELCTHLDHLVVFSNTWLEFHFPLPLNKIVTFAGGDKKKKTTNVCSSKFWFIN